MYSEVKSTIFSSVTYWKGEVERGMNRKYSSKEQVPQAQVLE